MKLHGALHLHSSYSYDAKLTLQELRELFLKEGLSFALMTEHTDELTKDRADLFVKECKALSDEKFIFIPGFEVPYKDAHVLMLGCRSFVSQHGATTLLEWKTNARLTVLAHPHRNNYVLDEVMQSVVDGVEIWNSQYDGKYVPRTASLALLGRLKKDNGTLKAFAGWDLHRGAHAGGPVLELEASRVSEGEIFEKIIRDDYVLCSRRSNVRLSSKGEFTQGNIFYIYLVSAFFIFVISLSKLINKILVRMGLRIPRRFVARVRRWI